MISESNLFFIYILAAGALATDENPAQWELLHHRIQTTVKESIAKHVRLESWLYRHDHTLNDFIVTYVELRNLKTVSVYTVKPNLLKKELYYVVQSSIKNRRNLKTYFELLKHCHKIVYFWCTIKFFLLFIGTTVWSPLYDAGSYPGLCLEVEIQLILIWGLSLSPGTLQLGSKTPQARCPWLAIIQVRLAVLKRFVSDVPIQKGQPSIETMFQVLCSLWYIGTVRVPTAQDCSDLRPF